MLVLDREESQELVLMVGGKKAFATYYGLDPKEADVLWKAHGLKVPVDWVRAQEMDWLWGEVVRKGSIREVAKHYRVSSSFLKRHLLGDVPEVAEVLQRWVIEDALRKYKSFRLAARMLSRHKSYAKVTEASLRKRAVELGVDVPDLLDWMFSNHANAKGRRAEMEFARIRGDKILEDLNKTQGSQASSDFVDAELGRVNVKSSKTYRLKAKTRRGDPYYGKFSTSAIEKSDHVALMLYDSSGRVFIGMKIVTPAEMGLVATLMISTKQFG